MSPRALSPVLVALGLSACPAPTPPAKPEPLRTNAPSAAAPEPAPVAAPDPAPLVAPPAKQYPAPPSWTLSDLRDITAPLGTQPLALFPGDLADLCAALTPDAPGAESLCSCLGPGDRAAPTEDPSAQDLWNCPEEGDAVPSEIVQELVFAVEIRDPALTPPRPRETRLFLVLQGEPGWYAAPLLGVRWPSPDALALPDAENLSGVAVEALSRTELVPGGAPEFQLKLSAYYTQPATTKDGQATTRTRHTSLLSLCGLGASGDPSCTRLLTVGEGVAASTDAPEVRSYDLKVSFSKGKASLKAGKGKPPAEVKRWLGSALLQF